MSRPRIFDTLTQTGIRTRQNNLPQPGSLSMVGVVGNSSPEQHAPAPVARMFLSFSCWSTMCVASGEFHSGFCRRRVYCIEGHVSSRRRPLVASNQSDCLCRDRPRFVCLTMTMSLLSSNKSMLLNLPHPAEQPSLIRFHAQTHWTSFAGRLHLTKGKLLSLWFSVTDCACDSWTGAICLVAGLFWCFAT